MEREAAAPMTHDWLRTESREVLPYRSSRMLDDAQLRLYDDANFIVGTSVPAESVDQTRFSPSLSLPKRPDCLSDEIGISEDLLDFVISVEDGALVKSIVAFRCPLIEMPEGEFALPAEMLREVSWAGTTRITTMVVLRERNWDEDPSVASYPGSWVAIKTFTFQKPLSYPQFHLEYVDEDWFRSEGVPVDASYVIRLLSDDFEQPIDRLPELIRIYANKKLFESLAVRQQTKVADALSRAMLVDMIRVVVETGFKAIEGDPEPNTILYVLGKRLERGSGVPLERIAMFARQDSSTKLEAVIQSYARLSETMTAAIKKAS